jgi:hypothetical protein
MFHYVFEVCPNHFRTLQQGRTSNFAHPALEDLIVGFAYSGKNSLAKLFPHDFQDSVPFEFVALAATAVSSLTHF